MPRKLFLDSDAFSLQKRSLQKSNSKHEEQTQKSIKNQDNQDWTAPSSLLPHQGYTEMTMRVYKTKAANYCTSRYNKYFQVFAPWGSLLVVLASPATPGARQENTKLFTARICRLCKGFYKTLQADIASQRVFLSHVLPSQPHTRWLVTTFSCEPGKPMPPQDVPESPCSFPVKSVHDLHRIFSLLLGSQLFAKKTKCARHKRFWEMCRWVDLRAVQ